MTMTQRYAGFLRRRAGEMDGAERPTVAEKLRQAALHMEDLERENEAPRAKPSDDETRAAFEAFISAPPFEKDTLRYPDDDVHYSWPGSYCDINVDLAWHAWRAATEQQHDAAAKQEDKTP